MNDNVSLMNDTNNINSYGQVNNKVYVKNQMSMMSIALLVAGIGFLVTGLIGFGFSILMENVMQDAVQWENTYNALVAVVAICSIISLVMYFVWIFRIQKASLGFQIFCISLYCITNGFTFGGIFYFVEAPEIVIAFAATGLVLLISYIVGRIMSVKVGFALGKIIMVICIVYLIVTLIVMIMSIFSVLPSMNTYNSVLDQWIYPIVIGISGILSVLFLTYSLWALKNMDQNKEYLTQKEARNIAIYYGFIILMNLIRIFYLVIQIIGRSRR